MRTKMYIIGIVSVVALLALGFRVLPAPWQGGVAGWFSALWYLGALAAGLGYWYKLDLAQASAKRKKLLAKARQALPARGEKVKSVGRQRAF